jgi:hypothetical protein
VFLALCTANTSKIHPMRTKEDIMYQPRHAL